MNKEAENLQYYTRRSGEKGLFLLIHNFNYRHTGLVKDSQKDADAILDAVAKLDFDGIIKENLTAREIIDLMEEIKKNELKNRFCLWVYVISHGDKEQQILGVDGKCVSVRHHIMEPFFHDCSQLTNKPKFFVVDACQGTSTEIEKSLSRHSDYRVKTFTTPTCTDASDWLLAYSCSNGHASKVGVYTPKLAEILQREINLGGNVHLEDMLIELCNKVTNDSTSIGKQVPVKHASLLKHFYLAQFVKLDSGYATGSKTEDEHPYQSDSNTAHGSEITEKIDTYIHAGQFKEALKLIRDTKNLTQCRREIILVKIKHALCNKMMGGTGDIPKLTRQWRGTISGNRCQKIKQVDYFFELCKLFAKHALNQDAFNMLQHAVDLYYELGDAQSGSPGLEQCVMFLWNLKMDQVQKDIEVNRIFQRQNNLRNHKINLQQPKQLELLKKIPSVSKLKDLITKKSKELETKELETKNMQTTSQLVFKLQIALPTELSMSNVKTLYLHDIQRKNPVPLNFVNLIAHLSLNAEGNRSDIPTLAKKKIKMLPYECCPNNFNTAQANEESCKNVLALNNQENLPTNLNNQLGANQNQYLEGKMIQDTNDAKETPMEKKQNY